MLFSVLCKTFFKLSYMFFSKSLPLTLLTVAIFLRSVRRSTLLEEVLPPFFRHTSTEERSYSWGVTEHWKVTFSCTHFFSRALTKNDQLRMLGKFKRRSAILDRNPMHVNSSNLASMRTKKVGTSVTSLCVITLWYKWSQKHGGFWRHN